MFGMIFSGFIFGICALIMIGIGFSQIRSREPVGFYNGEKPPSKEQLTDTAAWNRKHGRMWIAYGCCIAGSWVLGAAIGDSKFALVPYMAGVIVPIYFMIRYHRKLIKEYYKREGG